MCLGNAELSRFRSAGESTEALAGLATGRIDIAIGTHKLLGRDVKFKNLGLVIIDEEHRFGVRHKERLKALRAEVDVLTLTATPIPRTLAMSLEGIRDFSVIATAPQRRLAIRTGHSEKRSENVWKCCSTSSVVGTRRATCLPSATATNAARKATSVLPKPTSPQIKRSMGFPLFRSSSVALIAASWSGVSSNGKPSLNAS